MELNSQMPSFALETREECTGYVNRWFLQQQRAQDRRTARWLPLLVRLCRSQHTIFVFFSLPDEVLNEKDCSLLSMLYCKSLQKQIVLAFCNYFDSHYRMFAYIRVRSNNRSPSMTSQANSPHSSLLLGSGPGKD